MHRGQDLQLLRRFEPIIRYTRGEQFFPMDVGRYVQQCSFWVQLPNRPARRLLKQSEVTLETLAAPRNDGFGAVYFLKFIEPLRVADMAAHRLQQGLAQEDPRHGFRAGRGRLARVGYSSRLIDALFSLSLLARGRVPGDTAVAAEMAYHVIQKQKEEYCYYGRVVRRKGWTVLQYWFFYPFNNWRSGFFGANDHEADWETVCVYLAEDGQGELRPEWVAYSEHDVSGDDLRRRWDDPELETVGEHPVVYAGAGSHSGYYKAGEYLTEVPLPFLTPVMRFSHWVQKRWQQLGVTHDAEEAEEVERNLMSLLRVPFVDYARGDGLVLGPGQMHAWTPHLLDPVPDWIKDYRGLWGLFARDPISGENAPAGPMYRRNGTVRRTWYDPLGWAGLDKVTPPLLALERVHERRTAIQARCKELQLEIQTHNRQLHTLFLEAAAMRDRSHLKGLHAEREKEIEELAARIDGWRSELANESAVLDALNQHEEAIKRGEREPPRAHIRHAPEPAKSGEMEINRVAEAWAAMSIGLMLVGFVILFNFAETFPFEGLVALMALMIFAEAAFRHWLTSLIRTVTIALAFVCAMILLYEFFWEILALGVLLAGSYIMWENLRELWT